MRNKYILAAFILISGFIIINQGITFAATENSAEGVTISPPLLELEVDRGEEVTKTITVTNPLNKRITIYPVAYDFKASGETGEPTFMLPGEDNNSKSYSLAEWITFSKNVLVLESNEVEKFSYKINVPENGEPGGHYGVVFFKSNPPELEKDANQVAITSMVGSLVLVKVPGAIVEKGIIESFTGPRYTMKAPVNFVTRISNIGNIHFMPRGDIKIVNSITGESFFAKFNETDGRVLPNSTRKYETNWDKKGAFGRYVATLDLKYGESEKPLTSRIVFWVIPIWLIIVAAAIILIIIVLIIKFKRKKGKRREQDSSMGPRERKVRFWHKKEKQKRFSPPGDGDDGKIILR